MVFHMDKQESWGKKTSILDNLHGLGDSFMQYRSAAGADDESN
jgi:hypothetical protein